MKFIVLIDSPYRSQTEAAVGPFDTYEQAVIARSELFDRAERYPVKNGETVVHPDCIGAIVLLGSTDELASFEPTKYTIGPSGLSIEVDNGS